MTEFESVCFWYNYKADEYQTAEPTTDEIALEYLPQNPAAQSLYRLHRQMGLDILHAMVEVLTAVTHATEDK